MKTSKFNIILPEEDEESFILYNPHNGTVIRIDKELKQALEDESFSTIPPEVLTVLQRKKIVVPKTEDELLTFSYHHEKQKFVTNEHNFLITINMNCNLSCEGCPSHKDVAMSLETANTVINFIQDKVTSEKDKTVAVSLYGKEPLLNPDIGIHILKSMTEWANNNGIKLRTILKTNATLFNEKVFQELVPLISSFQITIHGNRDLHNKCRNNSYDKVMNVVEELLKQQKYVGLRYYVNDETATVIDSFLEDLQARKIIDSRFLQLTFNTVQPPYPCNNYPLTIDEMFSKGKFNLKWIAENLQSLLKDYLDKSILLSKQFIACAFIRENSFVIDPSGRLFLCPVYLTGDHQVGQILADGSAQLFSSYYELMTRNPANLECWNCNYLYNCAGGCPIRAKEEYGDYNKPYCSVTKELMGERLKTYMTIMEK